MSISRCNQFITLGLLTVASFLKVQAQDTTRSTTLDTGRLNMDAVYRRPFLQIGKVPVAVGGYVEANVLYANEDGVSEGISFQMQRLTLFLASSIHRQIRFMSEIEFEDGTKEINIEFAALDFTFHPLVNVRGGIVMNPIGAFNQNHDGPRWEFSERPISATQLLPATFSNVGFGLFGKKYTPGWVFGYEAYLTNGFDAGIISNPENKTFLPAAKANADRFEESFNGVPLFTGKVAVRSRRLGEIGLSYMSGVYNRPTVDGIDVDEKRTVSAGAVDFNLNLPLRITLTGEVCRTFVDVPDTYTQQYGERQWGGYVDLIRPLMSVSSGPFRNSVLNAALRLEDVDWNDGNFRETGANIYDDVFSVVPALSFRPSPQTVVRLNYSYTWQRDLFGNPPGESATISFGISSYF